MRQLLDAKRPRRSSIATALALFLGLAAVTPAPADDHATIARGFDRASAFEVGEVDHVNLFNGNLMVTLPIGADYPLGGGFSYRLQLVYNSKIWDLLGKQDLIGPPISGWQPRVHAAPTRHSNAGLGWSVGLGRLHAPDELDGNEQRDPNAYTYNESGFWIYVGADGGEHKFYSTLHASDADEDGENTTSQRVSYTRDGSYLRMKLLANGRRQIEFPDGAVHTFTGTGELVSIADRFGNDVTASGSPASGTVTLTDSLGRQQRIHYNHFGVGAGQISRIDVAAFGGARAEYVFGYTRKRVRRDRHNSYCGASTGACPVGPELDIDVLDSLELPDGSKYRFLYWDGSETPATLGTGALRRAVFPTGGFTEWKYGFYTTAEIFEQDPGNFREPSRSNTDGVVERVIFPCGGAAFSACPKWTYTQSTVSDRSVRDAHEITRVQAPDGHVTEHYFNIWSEDWDYGLPYSRLIHDGTSPKRYLSQKIFERQADQSLRHVRSIFVRYESDRDVAFPDSFILNDPRNMNQRMVSRRVLYADDNNRWADTNFSNFDGLGNFRSTSLTGNFGSGDQKTTFRQVQPAGRYEFDPETVTLRAGHDFSRFPEGSPWILGLATFEDTAAGGTTYRVETCHEGATGFLLRRRTLKNGTSKSDRDVLVAYSRDAQGNVTRESHFGGDVFAPPAETAACGVGVGTATYRIDHAYQHGVRRSTETLGAGFKTLDLDVDFHTGHAVTSRDVAGIATGYEYDQLGRPLWDKPGAGSPAGSGFDAWTEIVYTRAADVASPASNTPPCHAGAANQCARVTLRRHPNGSRSAGSVLTEEELVFDALGRPWRDLARLPAGSSAAWRSIETTYDAMGQVASVSEPGGVSGRTSAVTAPTTRYESYDAFGRVGRAVPPDGAVHAIDYAYAGERQTTRFVKVWTPEGLAAAAEQTVQHVERRDRLGRLREVAEDVMTVGAQSTARITTTYGYDPADRLISVTVAPGGVAAQQRAFFYDGRGFLLWEDHPEKSAAAFNVESATAGHDVQYGSYDPLGKAGRKIDGGSDLRYSYDAAGRVTLVSAVDPQTTPVTRPVKELHYTAQNATGDWAKGKLRTASRYNYLTIGGSERALRIDYVYSYGGRGGRVSDRATEVFLDGARASERFAQSWRWSELGEVEHLDYPQCTFAQCTGDEGVLFTDVAANDVARPSIEALFHAGVTRGCGTKIYCPSQSLTRAQAAVFLLSSIEGPAYQPPACTAAVFSDVPCSHPMAAWVNEFSRRGFTNGCGNGGFCPDSTLTREQIAFFLLVGVEGSGYVPPSCSSPRFGDVPCGSGFASWIHEANRRGYMAGCSGTQFCPQTAVTRREIAMHLVAAFEIPVVENPSHPRRLRYAFDSGALVGITGLAALQYHPNGLVHRVQRLGAGGAVTATWVQSLDSGMRRPGTITVDAAQDRTFGPYRYDGAGNVRAIGTEAYEYDRLGRLTKGTVGGGRWQAYAYDGFGNLTQVSSNVSGYGRNVPTSPQTNRLSAFPTKYDAAGNLQSWNGQNYGYDPLHKLSSLDTGTESWGYLYDADDERVWKFETTAGRPRHDVWTLRDLDGTVLRIYEAFDFSGWTVVEDFVHADGRLLAASNPKREAFGGGLAAARHYHTDHLGTARVVTVGSSTQASYDYFPYGEELTLPGDADPLRFAGHERDFFDPTSRADDLDAMHARFYNPQTGRFLSVDPAAERAAQGTAHAWNRYAYAGGSPLNYVDPDGRQELSSHERWASGLMNTIGGIGLMKGGLALAAKGGAAGVAGGAGLVGVGAYVTYVGLKQLDDRVTASSGCEDCVEIGVTGALGLAVHNMKKSQEPDGDLGAASYRELMSQSLKEEGELASRNMFLWQELKNPRSFLTQEERDQIILEISANEQRLRQLKKKVEALGPLVRQVESQEGQVEQEE